MGSWKGGRKERREQIKRKEVGRRTWDRRMGRREDR
jgi:hypothetical protein